MNPPGVSNEQGSAFGPSLLSLKRITKLVDVAQELFTTLYDLERQYKKTSKVRRSNELTELDLFGMTCNRQDSEAREYQPDDRDWYT